MWAKTKRTALLWVAGLFFGFPGSSAYANTLQSYVKQTIDLCEAVALQRAPLDSLNVSDWLLVGRDQRDNGNAGKQFEFRLQHTKVPWLTANISANGVGSTSGVEGHICSVNYNGSRHSFDTKAMPSWVKAQPPEISVEFSTQLRDLLRKLVSANYEQFEEDAAVNANEAALKTCKAGVRYKANIVMHDPSKNEVDAYFELRSSDWKMPC